MSATMPSYTIPCGSRTLALGQRTLIMGIVNVTPDSFSDGGRFFSPDRAISQALHLVDEGADILDIGGESTRPFSDPVGESEEADRVLPVIEGLAHRVAVPLSIDTTKAAVARQAVAAGATMINDVSALRTDREMAATAARCRVPIIVMHMKGTP
jgi:dihydropteroate synthase